MNDFFKEMMDSMRDGGDEILRDIPRRLAQDGKKNWEENAEIFEYGDCFKVRLAIALVLGSNLYMLKKFGAIGTDRKQLLGAALHTWEGFPRSGIEEIPVYGWMIGAPYDTDDDGNVIGEWPQIGTLSLPYNQAYIVCSGETCEGLRGLNPLALWRKEGMMG